MKFARSIFIIIYVCVLVFTGFPGCVLVHQTVIREELPDNTMVSRAVKLHLHDGRTVMFKEGGWVENNTIRGSGYIYSLDLKESNTINLLDLSDVAALEYYDRKLMPITSILISAAPYGIFYLYFINTFSIGLSWGGS